MENMTSPAKSAGPNFTNQSSSLIEDEQRPINSKLSRAIESDQESNKDENLANEEDPFDLAPEEQKRPEKISKRNSIKATRNSVGGSQGRASFGGQARVSRREARFSQGSCSQNGS